MIMATEFLNIFCEILYKYGYMEFYFITQKLIWAVHINCIFVFGQVILMSARQNAMKGSAHYVS